jgi:SHS2 domain-containing protein
MPPVAEWRHFSHGADIGVEGHGDTPAQAFEQAALALTAVVTDPTRLRDEISVPINCRARDLDLLLYEWLNAIVYQMATGRLLFGRFSVRITDGELIGEAGGEAVDVARHAPAVEVKGATFTELAAGRDEDGRWRVRCVLDV